MVRPGIRGVVLDLDDTLYLERDYVRSGFGAVAAHLATAWDVDAGRVRDHLWRRFTEGERGSHFDDLVSGDPALRDRVHVPDLVEVYRRHVPDIRLLPGVEDLIGALRSAGLHTGVVSDGALASQQAKVDALGIARLVAGPVVLTDVWGREGWKPHPRAFLHVQQAWDVAPDGLVYVGDNPHKDFDAPRDLGWACIRLRLPGQLHADVPDRVVPDLTVTSVGALAEALTPAPRLR
jgi:putative hydrolase of the HAD superfamily